MRSVARRCILALALCLPVSAAAAPHLRGGFTTGAGFGFESVSWATADGGRDVEGSGSGNLRVGWALKNDLVAGVEVWAWAKENEIQTSQSNDPVLVKFRLAAINACATFFPGGGGFFIRLGAGVAYGRLETAPPVGVTLIPADTQTDTGFAVNIAPGYEWRLSDHFALGAQGDAVYLGLGQPLENVFGYGVNAQFNWYW